MLAERLLVCETPVHSGDFCTAGMYRKVQFLGNFAALLLQFLVPALSLLVDLQMDVRSECFI